MGLWSIQSVLSLLYWLKRVYSFVMDICDGFLLSTSKRTKGSHPFCLYWPFVINLSVGIIGLSSRSFERGHYVVRATVICSKQSSTFHSAHSGVSSRVSVAFGARGTHHDQRLQDAAWQSPMRPPLLPCHPKFAQGKTSVGFHRPCMYHAKPILSSMFYAKPTPSSMFYAKPLISSLFFLFPPDQMANHRSAPGADDIVPVLIFVIIQSEFLCWGSNLGSLGK